MRANLVKHVIINHSGDGSGAVDTLIERLPGSESNLPGPGIFTCSNLVRMPKPMPPPAVEKSGRNTPDRFVVNRVSILAPFTSRLHCNVLW
jgi:hypothetical protein